MALRDKTLKGRLNGYSKADIIDALCGEFEADYHIKSLLITLNEKERKRAIANEENAFNEEMKAQDEYDEWIRKMIREHGDGQSVRMGDIPEKEIKKGAVLIAKLNSARNNVTIAMKKADRALGITGRGAAK